MAAFGTAAGRGRFAGRTAARMRRVAGGGVLAGMRRGAPATGRATARCDAAFLSGAVFFAAACLPGGACLAEAAFFSAPFLGGAAIFAADFFGAAAIFAAAFRAEAFGGDGDVRATDFCNFGVPVLAAAFSAALFGAAFLGAPLPAKPFPGAAFR